MPNDMKKPEGVSVKDYLTKRLVELRKKIEEAKAKAKEAAKAKAEEAAKKMKEAKKTEKGGKQTYYGMGKEVVSDVEKRRREQEKYLKY